MVVSPHFYQCYVNLPPNDIVPPEIYSNPKLYPFFQHCQGAIDGTHIDTFVPNDALTARYCNRKGCLSQNVPTACTFDMRAFHMSLQDGREVQLTATYTMMLGKLTFPSPQISATLLMQGFHYVTHSWFHIMVYAITSRNGAVQVKGMIFFY
jgi:hypothetical protein